MPFEGNSSTTVWDFLFLCTKKDMKSYLLRVVL